MSEISEQRASLDHMPISIFASVMGLSGLAIAISKIEAFFDVESVASAVITGLAVLVWLAIFCAYALKLVRNPRSVLEELNHPVRLSFFPTITIGLLLISIALLPHLPFAAQLIWWFGVVGQFAFTLVILDRWFHAEHFKTEHNSPAWFIPIVGNILVPVAGVEFGQVELSYFFFAVGLVFWLPMLAISLNRSFFHAPIPSKLIPTLFVLLAPPAVAFISWFKMHGEIDDVAVILYYFALFTLLMLISQFRRFIGLPFALSWWAFTFPLGAMAMASMVFYTAIPRLHYLVLGISLTAVLAALISYLLYRTVSGLLTGSLLRPE